MCRIAICVTFTSIGLLATGGSHAASVAVVDAEGKALAAATALCIDPASSASLSASGGRVSFADTCRRARCEANGFLPAEVDLTRPDPRCVLRPATIVRCDLPAGAGSGLDARLLKFGKEAATVATIPVPKAEDGATFTRLTFPPVKPGHYTLEIARARDGWSCRADLGPLAAGIHPVTPAWREPTTVGVRVKGADGKPAVGVPVRAWSGRPAVDAPGDPSKAIGAWTCSPPPGPPHVTEATGVARLPIDLTGEALIVAGDWKDARGVGYQTVDRAPAEALTLTLAAPVRLRAKVEDEKDRPVACDASLTDLSPEISWLTAVVTGAIVKAACDPQGGLALGPLPSIPMNVEVRPRVGLPIRVAVEAPAPGTVSDLGVLRVRSGERIRVVVLDDLASPVPGAKVTARGSAGVLLTIAGVTGEDGGVELTGVPKNASIGLDVKAKGFLPAHETSLDLDASPFVVTLARGAAISGAVHDADGQPMDGAEIGLTGDGSDGRRVEHADAQGSFAFDGVDDGVWRLIARAPGFTPSDPVDIEIREHRSFEDLILTLVPAEGLSGRVVDAAGSRVAGARVRLMGSQPSGDLDRVAPVAEAESGPDGSFQLRAAAAPEAWLVATKPGFGPCATRAPEAGAGSGEIVLALTEPASLIVHIPSGPKSGRMLRVRDGAGIGRTVATGGASELTMTDLAPGRGVAAYVGGPEKAVSLVARETADVTLDAVAAVEGRVTFDGAASPRVYVRASQENDRGQMGGGGGSFTDERGRYRIDGLGSDSYRIVAVGEDGRAEAKLDVADGETAHLDLALRSVRLVVTVADAANNKPIAGVSVRAIPGGQTCESMMGTSSWGDPGELGFEVLVGSNGCLSGQTNAAGVARLVLASPGSYDLDVGDDAYEPWKQALALVDGTTTRRVTLTRKPDQAGDKPHVIANLRTQPAGLSGTVVCTAGGNTNSSSPVSGRHDCGPMVPGPGEVRFHVEGYGRGRTAFDVPSTGEIVVDVDVPRGGTIVVPVSQEAPVPAVLVDASGIRWSDADGGGRVEGTLEDVAQVGRAWVFRDMPPSTYAVTIGGKARAPVPLASGGTAIAF